MTHTGEEESLTVALRGLAEQSPQSDPIPRVVAEGRRRVMRRRAVAVVATVAVLAVAPVALRIVDMRQPFTPAASPTDKVIPDLTGSVSVDCRDSNGRDHGVNSGTPDGASARATAPLEQAKEWADGSGFSSRYPATQPTEVRDQGAVLVVFKESGEVARGVLQFEGSAGSWKLTGLRYC